MRRIYTTKGVTVGCLVNGATVLYESCTDLISGDAIATLHHCGNHAIMCLSCTYLIPMISIAAIQSFDEDKEHPMLHLPHFNGCQCNQQQPSYPESASTSCTYLTSMDASATAIVALWTAMYEPLHRPHPDECQRNCSIRQSQVALRYL